MVQKLTHIKGLCFDFDGVFYDLSAISDINGLSDVIFAESAISILGDKIDYHHAKEMARRSYQQYGASITAFTQWAEDNGLDKDSITNQIFHMYHQRMHDRLLHVAPHAFSPASHIKAAFEKCKGEIVNGIATHGSIQNYATPILDRKELLGYFSTQAMFGLNDADYNRKSENTVLIQKCFNALNTPMSEGGFVEDSPSNLKVAKSYHPELTTIYIHHGKPLENKPSHVDFQFHDVGELKNAIHTAKMESPIILL